MMILIIKIRSIGARTDLGKSKFDFELSVFEALEGHIGKNF